MNIQAILSELHLRGISDKQIAEKVNAPQSIINRLRKGVHQTTSYERGSAIERLHKEITCADSLTSEQA